MPGLICSCPSLEVPQPLARSRGLATWRSTSRKSGDDHRCFRETKDTSNHPKQWTVGTTAPSPSRSWCMRSIADLLLSFLPEMPDLHVYDMYNDDLNWRVQLCVCGPPRGIEGETTANTVRPSNARIAFACKNLQDDVRPHHSDCVADSWRWWAAACTAQPRKS